ncbi:protein phosphatase 2C domain-containing protein [Streptomyces sp. NPDC048441]|uniref:protein phosphatase 2C domain-containing protein n=1 Tax=Streptomyces sp. NPDC048441 TaxID=3365552 RepID=UPI0037149854
MSGPSAPAGSQAPEGRWALLSATVKGVGKKYSQDSCGALSVAQGRAVVLTVADGHGSAAHFRSDLGSRWAVEEFTACAEGFAREVVRVGADATGWTGLRAEARRLPQQVAHRWRERVLLYDCNSPASGGRHLPGRADEATDLAVYGSTLIGAVLTEQMVFCWQLGDGDLVLVEADATPHTPHIPLSTGPEMGDETDSLCEPEPWRKMRSHWQPFTTGAPPVVLLSTDGLSKSFADHQGFLDFATGVTERAAGQGVPAVQAQLADWLERAAKYSGDDTTFVGAFATTARTENESSAEQEAEKGTAW